MMDMVEADIPRHPLQDFGQLIIGAPVHRCTDEIPLEP